MNKIEKLAQKDAERVLAAEMFYGEGAGNRRKLLQAEMDQKIVDLADTNYADAFNLAYELLDKNKFAKAAIRERKNLDRMSKANKNIRAFRSGNLNNLSTGVFVVVAGAYLAHQTGYDKKIEAEVKKQAAKIKEQFRSVQYSRKIRKMKLRVVEDEEKQK